MSNTFLRLPQAPDKYDPRDQDRTRTIIEDALRFAANNIAAAIQTGPHTWTGTQTFNGLLNLDNNLVFQVAPTAPPGGSWNIQWVDDGAHFLRLLGGKSAAKSGEVRVFSHAYGAGYDVDIDTPNAAQTVDTTRLGFTGGADWSLADFVNCTLRIQQTSGTPTQLAGGNQALFQPTQTISSAVDGTGPGRTIYAPSALTATDGTNPYEVHLEGITSAITVGVNGGAAAIGSSWCLGATMLVANSGNSQNEPSCWFGNMSAANGSVFRAWYTDWTLLGPTTGVQLNLAGGVTMLVNNYYNGQMAANGFTACFNAVSRAEQGSGAGAGEWHSKTTYAVDYGFYVGGWAGSAASKTAGFTVGYKVGGSGGMWNAAKHGDGTTDADAISILTTGVDIQDVVTAAINLHDPHVNTAFAIIIGATTVAWTVGIDIQEVLTAGVQLHNPNSASATAFLISAVGASTWGAGLDMSAVTCTNYAVHTGLGKVAFGDAAYGVLGILGTVAGAGRFPLVVYQNAGQSTTSTSDASIVSYSLPGASLGAYGQMVRITARGRQTVQAGSFNVKFGATVLATVAPAAGENWTYSAIVSRNGAATQLANTDTMHGTTPAVVTANPGETLSGAVTIDFRGSVTVGGTLAVDQILVEFLSSV